MPTDQQAKRIIQAQNETKTLLDKFIAIETRRADGVMQPLIDEYKAHTVRLQKMLDTGEGLPIDPFGGK